MSSNQAPDRSAQARPAGRILTTRIVANERPAGRRGLFTRNRTLEGSLAVGLAAVIAVGAGAASLQSAVHPAPAAAAGAVTPAATLRLGYLGNVTHAPALVGLEEGIFAKELGATRLSSQVFNAGPAAVEALNAGAIDAAYLGPNPAISSFANSKGESIRIIAGAASGGAQLVVNPAIRTAADLRGKVLASPQLGGTQDVALRAWLARQGYRTDAAGGGDVTINPTENAQTLKLFQDGKLDGAWLPEPWASRLVLQAGAKVLVNEKDLWDGSLTGKPGAFPTTVLAVSQSFLAQHPDTVQALLRAHVESVGWLQTHTAAADAATINAGLRTAAGAALPADVIARSLAHLEFTDDPLAGAYAKLLKDGVDSGIARPADLTGLFDLAQLNTVLRAAGKPSVAAAGLGRQ